MSTAHLTTVQGVSFNTASVMDYGSKEAFIKHSVEGNSDLYIKEGPQGKLDALDEVWLQASAYTEKQKATKQNTDKPATPTSDANTPQLKSGSDLGNYPNAATEAAEGKASKKGDKETK